MAFSIDDYVDVAERITLFYQQFPDGRLATRSVDYREWPEGGIVAVATAHRTADDPHPAVGTAWEPVPGKTQFTRDSEVQNAETAAWGRAIVACGIGTKKVASRQEVQARRSSPVAPAGRPVAARPSVPTPAAPTAAGDEHKRAHEAKTTLDVKDPDRRLINPAQRKRLFTVARTTYKLSDDTIRTVVESLTGSRSTSDIQRWQLDQVMADLKMAGESIPT
jgi:hypothetical protein